MLNKLFSEIPFLELRGFFRVDDWFWLGSWDVHWSFFISNADFKNILDYFNSLILFV